MKPKIDILAKIIAKKREEIAARKAKISIAELLRLADDAPKPESLIRHLRESPHLPVIAELKKASPSAGVIRDDFDVLALGKMYQQDGAAALSVLTDESFFQGSLDFLRQLRPHIQVPMLRKDFIIDEYQIAEARAAGADAILLIVAALEQSQLRDLHAAANKMAMDVLVEVHTADELEIAMSVDAPLIGINNRSLHTFEIDLAVTETLAAQIPKSVTLVGESGIYSADDARRLTDAGVHALLIGTSFMKQPDPGMALAKLIRDYHRFSHH